jgi:hypothetical protein
MKRLMMAVTGIVLAAVIAVAAACGDDDNGGIGDSSETPGVATATTDGVTGGAPTSSGNGDGPVVTSPFDTLEPSDRATVIYGTAIARSTDEANADATEEAEEAAEDAAEETADAAQDATRDAREIPEQSE